LLSSFCAILRCTNCCECGPFHLIKVFTQSFIFRNFFIFTFIVKIRHRLLGELHYAFRTPSPLRILQVGLNHGKERVLTLEGLVSWAGSLSNPVSSPPLIFSATGKNIWLQCGRGTVLSINIDLPGGVIRNKKPSARAVCAIANCIFPNCQSMRWEPLKGSHRTGAAEIRWKSPRLTPY